MISKVVCPLGSKCEEIKDNELSRCAWYVKLVGKDPQSEKDIDEWRCAMSWLPLMLVEVSQTNRGTAESVVSLRDESVKRQDIMTTMMAIGIKKSEGFENNNAVLEFKKESN